MKNGYKSKTSITARVLKEKKLVVKANDLVEANFKLTEREYKVFLYLISKVNPNEKELEQYSTNIKDEIAKIINPKETKWGNIYADLKQIIKALKSVPIHIYKPREDKTIIVNLLNDVEILENNGNIIYEISVRLKPYLLQLKDKYTSYDYLNIAGLSGFSTIRIFELLKQYEKIRERVFTIDELRKILILKPNQYKLYGHFKSRILEPAKKQINEKTDIQIDFFEVKTGRKVTGIIFTIKPNESIKKTFRERYKRPSNQLDIFDGETNVESQIIDVEAVEVASNPEPQGKDEEKQTALKTLATVGISGREAQSVWKALTENKKNAAYLKAKVELLRHSLKSSQREIPNPTGWLIDALKNDWRNPKLENEDRKAKIRNEKNRRGHERRRLEDEKAKIQREWDNAKKKVSEAVLQQNPALIDEAEKVFLEKGSLWTSKYDRGRPPQENYQNVTNFRYECGWLAQAKYPEKYRDVNARFKPVVDELEAKINRLENAPIEV